MKRPPTNVSTTSSKRGPGRPPGSKNKKSIQGTSVEMINRSSNQSSAGGRNSNIMSQLSQTMRKASAQFGMNSNEQTFMQTKGSDAGMDNLQKTLMSKEVQQQVKNQMAEWYINNYQEGKRMPKNKNQKKVLQEYFDRSPVWSHTTKMEIALKIGMTPGQVSKWNWDMRKKMGMSTERKKK